MTPADEARSYAAALSGDAWAVAGPFAAWVTGEVLVSIRKHGCYPPPGEIGRRPADLLRTLAFEEPTPGAIVVELDGAAARVGEDGQVEPVLPGGHPRPGVAHATARRRAR